MKLLTYEVQEVHKLGVQTDNGIIDIQATAEKTGVSEVETDIMSVIAGGKEAIKELSGLLQQAEEGNTTVYVDSENLVWGPSVTRPHKIICVGLNYRKHADETNAPYPEVPILFNKFDNTLTGHKSEIPVPKVTEKLDYEVELAIVIGKKAKNVKEADALDYVFGYSAANDLSARDLQMRTQQWMLGKIGDKFSPLGPYLVTADEVGNPDDLNLKTTVNGEVKQDSNTSDMIFNCSEIVSYLSQYLTLEPGDVILTGTPEGVVLGLPEDQQVYIQPGDVITCEIEKLGAITNYYVEEK